MQNKNNIIYLFFFILLSSIAFAVYFETNSKRIQLIEDYPLVEGILDLSDIEIGDYQIVSIEGQAEFFWSRLLSPDSFSVDIQPVPDGYVEIPGIWNHFSIHSEKVGSFGYATYRFLIKVKNDGWYGLKINEFDTAYKIWINSNRLVESGNVATSKSLSKPDWKRKEAYFESRNGEIEVILQISNFEHRKGGAEDRMFFGAADNIMSYKKRQVAMSAVLLGVLIMLCIYHLVLYVFRPKDVSILLFTLLSFFMALRLVSTGEKLIFEIFPSINWFLAIRIEYLSYQIAFPLILAFFYSFYKQYIAMWVMKATIIVSALFSVFVIVAPIWVFSYSPIFFQIFVAAVALYMLVVLIQLTFWGKDYALFFLIGYVFFLATLINDILYYNKIINSTFILHFGIFILALSQAFVLSRKYSMAFIRIEHLSGQLALYNMELEETVQKRTTQIKSQKDEIETQAIELKQVNEKLIELTRFKDNLTEMIVHDMKSPINMILNFSTDEKILFAGTQMLNMVHNMLDVQRYENTKMKLHKKSWPLVMILNLAISQIQYLIQQKNIKLNIDDLSGLNVYADKDILGRVCVNLLSNAGKFTPMGGVIKISAHETERQYLKFCISDSGPGIPGNMKGLVFQKLGQFASEIPMAKGSSGIGLAFCKLAIEAHRGSIDYISAPGAGATFCCEIESAHQQNQINNEKIEVEKCSVESFVFTGHEKQILSEIVNAMQNTKIYEIGKLKGVIARIQPNRTENISIWIKCIKQAIFNADYERFNQLLQQAAGKEADEK